MTTYHEFDQKVIEAAVEAALCHYDQPTLLKNSTLNPVDDGHLSISGGCIYMLVEGGKICLNLPLGIGSICVPIPQIFPDGTAAQACISICSIWGVPTGARLTVIIAGQVIINKTFLKC